MKRSIMAAVIALGGVAGCAHNRADGRSQTDGTVWGMLGLFFVGVVLYIAVSSLIARLPRRKSWAGDSFDLASGRALRRRGPHVHYHRGQRVDSGHALWLQSRGAAPGVIGSARGTDPSDSVPPPPAP